MDAPEFVEGWGMYSEQMMREQGFDDAPNFRLNMYTDAIWRAVRIILDVRMHRGEISVPDAIRFMVDQTSFEEANARAEVHRYTYTPSYQLSYLLGKVLLLQLRADERRRLGKAFDLRRFHDTLLENGGLPISFHRRLLERDIAAQRRPVVERHELARGGAALSSGDLSPSASVPVAQRLVLVIPSIDLERGRSRIVYWPGASAGVGAPTDRPEVIAERFVALGARVVHLVDFDGARDRHVPPISTSSAASPVASRSRSRWPAAWRARTRSGSRSPPARRASCSR